MKPLWDYAIRWSRSRPLSYWGVLIQWVGFSIYFAFVNAYLAALFLSLFIGYFSSTAISVYLDYRNDKEIPSR